jgi:GTP-binding protein
VSLYPAADFLTSAAQSGQFPDDQGAEVAFAGRSNSGKSSAINAILARRGLARSSKTPGRTRLLNFFVLAPGRRVVDLPGYGYATASAAERATWAPMIDALARRASLRGLFLVIDSRRGVMEGDWGLLEWAEAAQLPAHVLLSKSDKLKRAEARTAFRDAQVALNSRAEVQLFSVEDEAALKTARATLDQWLSQTANSHE